MVVLDVYIPTGKLGVILKDGIDVGGFVTVVEILEGSQMFGELMESVDYGSWNVARTAILTDCL
jgi:hypothetical protein